jgi:hypothetical protein
MLTPSSTGAPVPLQACGLLVGEPRTAHGLVQQRSYMDTASQHGVYTRGEFPGQLRDNQLLKKKKTVPWSVAKRREIYMHATQTC